jgi:putative nucleotidyltransferase with HDIG domain
MRKNIVAGEKNAFSILALDDDEVMTITLQSYFQSSGFQVDIENDPMKAVDKVRENTYDIMLLDFLMSPICGDEVVSNIREFNKDIFIILLTGHKSMAPPIKTIRDLDIQGYYEKSDRFDQLELLVESCVKSIRQMRTIRKYRDGLKQMMDSIPGLYSFRSVDGIASAILDNTLSILECDSGCIYLEPHTLLTQEKRDADFNAAPPEVFVGRGKYVGHGEESKQRLWRLINSVGGQADGDEDHSGTSLLVDDKNRPFGLITADIEKAAWDGISQLFELYANQAASAISNVLLQSLISKRNNELAEAYSSLNDNYMEMIDAMRLMVDTKDIYTRGHSDRVAYFATLIAEAMGKDSKYLERLKVAGLFHDIGKIGTSDLILGKSTSLTEDEYRIIKKHPSQGRAILSSLSAFSEIAHIVECHHERVDGMGYPLGLVSDQIPEEARILCVADAFDAMTSNRKYRSAKSLAEAIGELKRGKDSQFDAQIVDAFLQVLNDYEHIKQKILWTYGDINDNDISA